MTKILMIAADGTAIDHLDYAMFRMKEEGFDLTVAAPEKRPLKTTTHWGAPDKHLYYVERPGYTVTPDAAFRDIDPAAYDALLVPGGRAPEYLRNNAECMAIVRHFIDADKPIAATCHGPLILLGAGVKGRRMTCTDDTATDVTVFGNTFEFARGLWYNEPDNVTDGNIVTSRGWFHYHDWIREFIKMLRDRGLAEAKPAPAKTKRILMIAGDHSSSGQVAYGLERMLEAGHEVVIAAPEKRMLETIIDQREEGWDMADVPGVYMYEYMCFEIPAGATLEEVDPAEFDGLLLPGGRGPEYLRNEAGTREIVRHFMDAGKPVGTICQAPRYLLAAGVTGMKLAGLEMIRTEIEQANTYVAAADQPVIDRNVVSVSGRPYYHVWTREFLRMLDK